MTNAISNLSKPINSIEAMETLQNLISLGILNGVDADVALQNLMKLKAKEKETRLATVYDLDKIKKFFNKQKNQEMWKARYGERCKGSDPMFRATTREAIIDKLYEFYFGETEAVTKIPTVAEAFKMMCDNERRKKAVVSSTIEHYIADWSRYIEGRKLTEKEIVQNKIQFEPAPFLNKPINKVTKVDIIDHLEYIVGDGRISGKTFSNIRTVINMTFRYAGNIDGIDVIDTKSLEIKIRRKCFTSDNQDKVYSSDQRNTLLKYLERETKTVYVLAIMFIFCTDARLGELLALTWNDIDYEGNKVIFQHQIVKREIDGKKRVSVDVPYMKGHSKTGKRSFPLSDYALKILYEAKKINGDKHYIFQSAGNMPISENRFNEHLSLYCEKAGIPYFSAHKIRFEACSAMYAAGVPEKDIQAYMGHSSVTTTRHYDRRQSNPDGMTTKVTNTYFGAPT